MKLASIVHNNGLTAFNVYSFTPQPCSISQRPSFLKWVRVPFSHGTSCSKKTGLGNEPSTSERDAADDQKIKINLKKRVVVVGGTGRVGGSTAIALSKFCSDLHITIAGRNRSPLQRHPLQRHPLQRHWGMLM
ncbi:hypothetical protein LIER_33633 [Lithospermum erythrorhizon]|uniref:Uncharacterized protein n=1 Tax=Lithospermum erythrorhizon TaxID=34254 RepID=A0AAV3S0H8_LITER